MSFPSSNNIDGGAVLALSNLLELTVSADNSSIAIGPGNRWGDVYSALAPYGRFCVGGRMPSIGVPGLSLIGGMHYFNNRYGYTMDNVIHYEVVLGNGTQTVANATVNKDLFWALKGGANNFAIVTTFVLQTFPMTEFSTTKQSFHSNQTEAFIEAAVNLVQNSPGDIGTGGVIIVGFNATAGTFSANLEGVQETTVSPPSRFSNFSAIGPVSESNSVQTPEKWFSKMMSPFQLSRIQFACKSIVPDSARLWEIVQAWGEAASAISDVEGLRANFVINLLPESALAVAKNNGVGNVWGLQDSGSLIVWQLSTSWANAEDDFRMTSWARNFVDHHHRINQDLGLSSEFMYMGDAGEWQNPFLGFPAENVEKMRAVQTAYDPIGVFKINNWGGFKLPYE